MDCFHCAQTSYVPRFGPPYCRVYIYGMVYIAFVVSWRLLISPLYAHNRAKPWRRVIGDVFNRFLANSLPLNQHQYLVGNESDVETYKDVVSRKNTKQEPIVDDLGQGAKLMWLGEKRTDKVFLYLHGASLISCPAADTVLTFLRERWWLYSTICSQPFLVHQHNEEGDREERCADGLRVPRIQ